MRLELTNTGSAIRRLSRLATRARRLTCFSLSLTCPGLHCLKRRQTEVCRTCLERKERFELSKRVWKTRMFPATSLPQGIADFQLARFRRRRVSADFENDDLKRKTNRQSAIGNQKCLEPPIGLEPTPDSFEANRSSVKLRGHKEFRIAKLGLRI